MVDGQTTNLLADLTLEEALPGAPFRELHRRETVVVGTDRASTRRFAPYWAFIRLPSGLIRRSWLAAIDRRVAR